ncbi:NAD(P)-dependent dehydrogenase (short-subunit alcohol dehydrogenase family) [Paraburkholderia sp. MM5496-R1]|uniref:SDR family oxidoreductase n=1 Tax=unclassified Paraburkholderia TaxID=2615204 RepID=UPI003D1FDFF2
MNKYVLVTGTSTGIGYDAARELIANGCHVFGSVRSVEDGERVGHALGDGFSPLVFDVTDEDAIAAAVATVEAMVGSHGLTGLVNNAGIAPVGPLMHMPVSDFKRLLDINVTGVLRVTQAFLPLLGAKRGSAHPPGRIVNVSSNAGCVATPMAVAYSTSKFAVEAMTDGLRRELSIYGIHVAAIEPGPIRTPIWDKARRSDLYSRYAATDFSAAMEAMEKVGNVAAIRGQPVETVSAVIRDALLKPRPKARYPLNPMWHISKFLPTRLLDKALCRRFNLRTG